MVRKKNSVVKAVVSNAKPKKASNPRIKGTAISTECSPELLIGKVLLGATFNCLPEKWLKCKLSFLTIPEEVDKIHVEFDEISVLVTLIIDTGVLREIISSNIFTFNFSIIGEDFFADIHFKELPLKRFNSRIGDCVKTVLIMTDHTLSGDDVKKESALFGTEEITKFYKLIKRTEPNINVLEEVQHSSLKPKLRLYQKEAVKWMLARERSCLKENVSDVLHPLYIKIELPSGLTIYYDKYSGHICTTKPVTSSIYNGGILAEEMGLGKTVEFLALILNHPNTCNSEYSNDFEGLTASLETDSEVSDNDEVDIPIIKKQMKKRTFAKKRKKQTEKEKNVEFETRDIKVPSDWVKNAKKKTDTRIALELWYNSALSEVNAKPTKCNQLIECICGEIHKSDKIKCTDCGKFQHKSCLGYKERFGPFICPSCWLNHPLVESGATLIVTPVALRTQWCNEIKMHVDKKFRVLVYEGSNKTPIYPTYFKDFDVVITTYNVLQAEFRLTDKGQVYGLRRKRKYDFQGSSLSRIKWWRLCLDEAQTVETPGKIVSAMARKLTAKFRWAVTGTPMSKDISDLYGLIDYLQIEPYNELDTWTNILYNPYLNGNVEPLCSFLARVMWRSSKADVIDQIGIPEQSVIDHSLEFSAVEKFFYNKEHEFSSQAFLAKLKNVDTTLPLAKLNKGLLKKIMQPLLSLRQACTHPNTVRGKYLATRKKISTMKELLEALISENATESEEHLRLVVCSLNGLAGIYLLMQDHLNAASEYRKVLQLSARFSENKTADSNNLTVDKLQLIHTMHNLADLLEAHSNIPPTLHDSSLRADCKLLEQKYIEKFINNTLAAYQDSNSAQSTMNKLEEQLALRDGEWFSDGIEWITIKNFSDEFANRIRHAHDMAHVKCPINLESERSILLFIATWVEEVTNCRADLIEMINGLFTYREDEKYKITIDQIVVHNATDCHLRPEKKQNGKTKKCALCLANTNLKKYEFKIFTMEKRTATNEEMCLQGSWKPTSQELMLKALFMVMRAKNADEKLIKDGEVHMNILDNLKKEFKEIRKLWTHIYQQVAAQDELEMCKIKLRLADPNANEKQKSKDAALKRLSYILENKLDTVYMLNEHELEYHMMLLKSDEAKGSANLEKSLGTKSYLETLRKQQYEGQSPDPCPVCRNVLELHWSILPCGHNYCMECIHKLLEHATGTNIICCVCRQSQVIQNISYIKSEHIKNENIDSKIKGNFSTKVEAVIKFLLELKEEDKNVKVLVFSSWVSVLKILKDAFLLNGIESEILLPSKLEERIERFKDAKEQITTLLLPISLGGKGLNLIESTHVILMEPLLDPGDELQAIGRVHRIGQTRPTFVHKFFIKNTIEESILTSTSADADKWDRNRVTLDQLQKLFINSDCSTDTAICDTLS